ncbi:MAG TPA: ABC transporter substrate-binding protein [Chloroflexota bacterium]|nr:ABC transporter substrate-binding protein [Chloroflexota bacterium]
MRGLRTHIELISSFVLWAARTRQLLLTGLTALVVLQTACMPVAPPITRSGVGQEPPAQRVFRVGFLSSVDADSPLQVDGYQQLLAALVDLGHEIGKDVIIEYRSAGGNGDLYPDLVSDLVSQAVDVIVVGDSRALIPALNTTKTIPIVTAVGDIRAVGLVGNIGSPEANLTGVSNFVSGLSAKRLEMLKEIAPTISRVAVIRNPADPGMVAFWNETLTAANALQLQVLPFDVQQPADLESAFQAISEVQPDALIVLPEPLTNSQNSKIAAFALSHRLPSAFGWRAYLDNGGLLYMGSNRAGIYRTTAGFVHRILQGASPSELPVEQPTRFDIVINAAAAQALGVSLSASVQNQATEIIQ